MSSQSHIELLLRQLIREEIGRNYKTINNDPYQYYETFNVHYEVYPAENGYNVEISVPEDSNLNPPIRKFNDKEEAELYGRHYIEYVHRTLDQRSK